MQFEIQSREKRRLQWNLVHLYILAALITVPLYIKRNNIRPVLGGTRLTLDNSNKETVTFEMTVLIPLNHVIKNITNIADAKR